MHGAYRSPRLPGALLAVPRACERPEALRGNLARRMHRQVQAQTAGGQADLAKVAGKICQDIRRHVPRAFVHPGCDGLPGGLQASRFDHRFATDPQPAQFTCGPGATMA